MKFTKLVTLVFLSSVGVGSIAVQPANAFLFGGSFGGGTSMNEEDFSVSLEISDLKSDNGAADGNQVKIVDDTFDASNSKDTNESLGLFKGAIENFLITVPNEEFKTVISFKADVLDLEARLDNGNNIKYRFLLPDGKNVFDEASKDLLSKLVGKTDALKDALKDADEADVASVTASLENLEKEFFELKKNAIEVNKIDSKLAVNDLTYILNPEIPNFPTTTLLPDESFGGEVTGLEYTRRPIDNVSVPEPGITTSLLAYGVVSAVALLNRKRKQLLE